MMLAYSASELWSITVMQSFSGLSLFSVLLLMALGLAIIFGQMGVVNLAHGEFMALGAYTVYLCSTLVSNHAPSLQPYYFIIAIVVAFFVAALVGWFVEWALIRFLYKRPLDTLLATWGLSLIMQQAFRSTFGAR
ncbi:MAG TPA: urea ABC transporter permease subunit UrtB, partial [Candidatus Paceibacterota bacterium]|nr:urea ABC transporter permease subunit UrtB [Candidatus Paceibacterota bacterium]